MEPRQIAGLSGFTVHASYCPVCGQLTAVSLKYGLIRSHRPIPANEAPEGDICRLRPMFREAEALRIELPRGWIAARCSQSGTGEHWHVLPTGWRKSPRGGPVVPPPLKHPRGRVEDGGDPW